MSEFIFIVPEGWTAFSTQQMETVSQPLTAIQNLVDVGNYADVTTLMREASVLQANEYLIEGKVFNGEILVARVGID